MQIRTVGFNPLKVEVDGVETPIVESIYQDEKGDSRKVLYVVAGGEKVPIQYQGELKNYMSPSVKLDEVLVKVEEARIKNIEDPKKDEEIKP